MTTATYPIAPEITPLEGTLLHAATVKDGIAWLDGQDLWPSSGGMTFGAAPAFCAPNTKNLDTNSLTWVSGFLFGAYGGFTCKPVGTSLEEMESNVREAFNRGESTAVERAFMQTRFRAAAGVNAGRWAAPVDITPAGGAQKPAVGLAMLEGHFASLYSGSPTIHMPRVIASLLLGVDGISVDGSALRTKLGSLIAAGSGYDYPNTGPTGANAAAGEKWMYASGPVFLGRSETTVRSNLNMSNNDGVVLAERAYIGATDGPVLAVRVTVTA
jgi:hypothetical protein